MKASKRSLLTFCPNNRAICYGFNKGNCDRDACDFEHVCLYCAGSHASESCQRFKEAAHCL